MEKLRLYYRNKVEHTPILFKRYLWNQINWKSRLIVLLGARGVGKTTLLLQYIKEQQFDREEALYVSLDDIYFANHTIIELAEDFIKEGGTYLFLDEVQKYPNWSVEVKNIYDNYPELQLVLSGSSAIELFNSRGDLSRRAVYYRMTGLSFREFINYKEQKNLQSFTVEEIIEGHRDISFEISRATKPIKLFKEYLKFGYYPYFEEDVETYHQRVAQVLYTVLEVDIPQVFHVDYGSVEKIKKLLAEMATMVPFKPNISSLSRKLNISRDILIRYLKWLERADIIQLLYSQTHGISALNKPEKIYLNNSNMAYAIHPTVNTGSIREGFFLNQLAEKHQIRYPDAGDFIVDDKWLFEIGGLKKNRRQITGIENSYVVQDDLEVSTGKSIPLWLFGFIY
ncbi:MAG: AAA family ATPase [Cyclobacteriaceae bacterium]|nr:AAA family ATPase [Cyclobacteriaceae bacterium]